MTNSTDIPPVTPGQLVDGPQATFVDEDHACVFCGYNLRTLSLEAVCPECGTPVSRSIHAAQLIFTDLGWSWCTFLGTLMTLIWLVCGLVIFIFIIGNSGHFGNSAKTILLILHIIPILLACSGFLATRKCRRDPTLSRLESRKACRFSIACMVLIHAVLCSDYFLLTNFVEALGEELVGACYSIFFVSYLLCFLRYLTHASSRSTNKLIGFGQAAFWSLFGFSAILFLIAALSRTNTDFSKGLFPLLGILTIIAFLTLICVFLFLLGMSISLWLDLGKATYFLKSHVYPDSMKMRLYEDQP